MDAVKAGMEKTKESMAGKKADDKMAKAHDPTKSAGERVDAALDAGKAKTKEQEHACKAECHKDKHAHK
jgi:hypothetical protein